MPQFEVVREGVDPTSVRARSAEDAVRRWLADAADSDSGAPDPGDADRQPAVALADAEAGTGWQAVTVDGEPWGQVRPRDRMRFRRD